MADVPKLDIAGELRVRARVEASRVACLAEQLIEYQAANFIEEAKATIATQAAQIEALTKALEASRHVVADRAAGGRMLISSASCTELLPTIDAALSNTGKK